MLQKNLFKASISTALLIGVAFLFGCANEGVETANAPSESTNVASVAHAPEFTAANFQSEVLESTKVVLVDCWAVW